MKKLIALLATCVLLLDTSSFAQEIEWQNTIGGSGTDNLYSMQQTADGGYILGGYSASGISGDKTENCNGGVDYWIVKTDSSGDIQWQNTIGGTNSDALNSIQQTADGGYILGGTSPSNISGDKAENSNGGFDYWIVKTDASGNILWQNTIGGSSDDYLNSIRQTIDGGYILGGESYSNISGDKTEDSNGDKDYWIVKTDATGNIQWQNTIGGSDEEWFYSIQQTTDGGFILGGFSSSNISGDKTENSNGYRDYWIVKTDTLGNIEWQNTIGGSLHDQLSTIQQTADGGYIIGGSSWSSISGDKTENSNGYYDYWLVKTDLNGNVQWQNTIGGSSADYLISISQTTDGGYALGGRSLSNISGDKTEYNNGDADFWIVKTDASGNIHWQNTIGGNYDDFLYSIQQTFDGGFIVGGFSQSNNSGDKSENSNGDWDYWLMKLTDKFNSITGKIYYDPNSNQTQDAGEPSITNSMVTELNSNHIDFSKPDGSFSVNVLDSGNFTIFPITSINYYAAIPSNHNAYFSGIHQTDSLNDFAFQPTGLFNDLCVTITPMGNFRAGMNASYMINYENVGTTTLSPTVIFFPDNDVTFVSANPVANSVTVDSVVWNFGPLAPFQTGSILVTVNVNVGTPIGTLINSNARIEPVAGDNYPGCNYAYWEVLTTGSYDPNEILVDEDTVFTTQLSNPPYLDYIIYFQNTGNDTAFNARILNNLPTELDVTTFEFVASSHSMNITYGAHARLMTFTFDNILLPDSNINEPESHGFIRYRIKPNTILAAGDSIRNTAFIYFDFNAPVQTNTAVTEIVLPTGIEAAGVSGRRQFAVYPNPANGELIVRSSELGDKLKYEITISDVTGRQCLRTSNSQLPTKLDVSRLADGVYVIQLTADEKVYRAKFVKQ